VRFPNLPLVVGFWSAASFRSRKGRPVVVDPVSGRLEIFLLREERRYNGLEGGVVKVFVVVDFVAVLVCLCSSWIDLCCCSTFSPSYEFGIEILVDRVF